MTDLSLQDLTPDDLATLRLTISAGRISTYLIAAGHDETRAFKLYLWNAHLGEAFHTPIQAVEVGLRNRVNLALSNIYTPNWWECRSLTAILDDERRADLSQVFKRIRNRRLDLWTGQVVAGLSFGFWVGLLDGRYNAPIWSKQLRVTFPNLPVGRSRGSLFKEAGKVATLRNRISHHEPLIGRDISSDFATLMQLLSWICPVKSGWIKPYCRVPAVLRLRP